MADDLSLDGLPDETVDYIKRLRREAARYRTERNDFEEKYTQAETLMKTANTRLDEFSALEDQLENVVKEKTTLATNYDRLRAAAEFGIPDEVERLKGTNYEEWKIDAETLSQKLKTGRPGIPKDPAAKEKPAAPKTDPITNVFREAGWL